MPDPRILLELKSEDATAQAARLLAGHLHPGDVVLLNGPVGAGKSHFSRHLIRALLSEPEDIPSPTFTLVQTYDTVQGELWHSDLYRLGSTSEIEELGLIDAFEEAICIIEWPDRLGDLAPEAALTVTLSQGQQENSRILSATWTDAKWAERTRDWDAL